MKVKMKDIAEAAGVSPATVSLVLNNKPSRISSSTQESIRSIAKEMQMKQGMAAESVSIGPKTIGLIIPDVMNGYYNALSNGVNRYMQQQGYTVLQCNIMNSNAQCLKAVEDLTIKNVDGIILLPPYHINNDQDNVALRRYFQKSELPVVLLDQAVHNLFTDFITADNKQGAYLAAKHLLDLGHERIGCILGPKENYVTRKRLEGYKQALAEAKVIFEEDLLTYSDFSVDSGRECMEKLDCKRVTSVFAANDLIALGVYQYAQERKIKIPNELSVVGYDNTMFCDLLPVKLTSIEQNADSMGAKAAEVLLGRMDGNLEEESPRNYYFAPLLVERQSVKRLER